MMCRMQAVGRRRLALLLLEEESSCALQVPLLLSLASSVPAGGASLRPAGAYSFVVCLFVCLLACLLACLFKGYELERDVVLLLLHPALQS
jgi:hypothetical protein